MRLTITIAAILLACTHATGAAAQTEAHRPIHSALAIAPLPASLAPNVDGRAAERASRLPVRRVLVSAGVGALVGAGAGLVIGALASDGCGDVEDWCLFSREEEVALATGAGAIVGAGIGAIYGIVTGIRQPACGPAPVTVALAADGGVRMGVALRH